MHLYNRYKTWFLLLFLSAPFTSTSQSWVLKGHITDKQNEEAVPFASVILVKTSSGTYSDSAGRFFIKIATKSPDDSLAITCTGYRPVYVPISKLTDTSLLEIKLEQASFMESAVVKVKVNKGLLVWKKIVQHKEKNNPYRFDNFSYELYNKLEIDLINLNLKKVGNFKPFKPVTELINQNIDSSEGSKYLPAYLTEVISDYYYQKNPKRRREIIKAANTNGVKNESFLKFLGGTDQVVNVYNNFIPVLDKQFVSPASDNGDYYYNYKIIDTQTVSSQRFFHLVFTPRRKGGDMFEGDCWVHAGSYAIQKMNLRLSKEADINFVENLSLIQEYKKCNDSTWFLYKDKFVIRVSPAGRESIGFIGRKTTTYANIVINDSSVAAELDKNKKNEEIITLPSATEKSKEYWEKERHEPLSKTESGIVRMIDTLTTAPAFQRFTKTVTFIGTGYKDVGNYEIGPWMNWISSNGWEGLRVRFDLGTNKYFNRKIKLHSYLAYGFGDKKMKGMAEAFYLPKKDPRMFLYASYTNDLDWGQNYYGEVSQDNVFSLAIRKNGIPVKNMKVEEKRFEMFGEVLPWMSNKLTVIHKTYDPLRNLVPADSFSTAGSGRPFTDFEVSFRLRFAWLERFLENHFYRTSLGSSYPIGEINITKGFSGVLKSSYDYVKLSASISEYTKLPPFGSLSWRLYAGKTFGTLPYMLLDVAPGNELYYYNTYAFNMMNRWEFIHDKYAGINIEHNIGRGVFRFFPKLKLRQLWTAKALWGSLSPENKSNNFKQGHSFQSLDDKTYLELGTGVDNILKVFRIDLVWRVLPSTLPKTGDKTFGIFGSFRIVF